jgi:hypothetical protein
MAIAGRVANMAVAEGLAHVGISRPIFEPDWPILYQVVMIPMALAGGYANTWGASAPSCCLRRCQFAEFRSRSMPMC